MNKSDLKLIIITFIIAIIILFMIAIINKDKEKKALVYYDNELILTIDLNKNETKDYYIDGFNGTIKLVTQNGKIKVDEEESPLHLCSKQGFISESYETIICLPNKVVIKISNSSSSNFDTIVR